MRQYPTLKQANVMFLVVSLVLLTGSAIFIPKIGIGTNLWINEFIWILAPVLTLSKVGKWSSNEVFKLESTSKRNKLIAITSAISFWICSFYLSKSASILLNTKIGIMDIGGAENSTNVNQSVLLLIGMVLLAPICEELFFRGFIQSAYERYNKKYGFVYSAILFGMFHILNGLTEVIPTFLIGLVLGYLVHRTESIAASMLAHMAFNMSAIVFNGAFGLAFMTTIPVWLPLVSLGGLTLGIFLLSNLTETNLILEETTVGLEEPSYAKFSTGGIVFFILSGLFVIFIGVVEIYARSRG